MHEEGRIPLLTVARGLAMLLVILGHALTEDIRASAPAAEYLFRLIYRFHMPLWFLLSGLTYGAHRKRYEEMGLRYPAERLRRLILPYVLYGAAVYGVFFLASRLPFLSAWLAQAGHWLVSPGDYALQALLGENPYAYHLWFLEALFLLNVIGHGICVLGKARANRLLVLLAAVVVLWRLVDDQRPGADYPWIVYAVMRDLPWYLLGILLAEWKPCLPEIGLPAKLLITILSVSYMTLRILWFPPLMTQLIPRMLVQAVEYASAMGLILSVLWLAQAIGSGAAGRAVACLGRRSMTVYLLHQPLCSVTGLALWHLGWPALGIVLTCMLVSLVLPLAASAALHRAALVLRFYHHSGKEGV